MIVRASIRGRAPARDLHAGISFTSRLAPTTVMRSSSCCFSTAARIAWRAASSTSSPSSARRRSWTTAGLRVGVGPSGGPIAVRRGSADRQADRRGDLQPSGPRARDRAAHRAGRGVLRGRGEREPEAVVAVHGGDSPVFEARQRRASTRSPLRQAAYPRRPIGPAPAALRSPEPINSSTSPSRPICGPALIAYFRLPYPHQSQQPFGFRGRKLGLDLGEQDDDAVPAAAAR